MGGGGTEKGGLSFMKNMAEAAASITPSIAPAGYYLRSEDEILASQDRQFALHGKIMMLALILIFCAFLFFLSFVPCIRRIRSGKSILRAADPGVPFPCEICPLVMLRKRKDDLGASTPVQQQQQQPPKDEAGTLLYC